MEGPLASEAVICDQSLAQLFPGSWPLIQRVEIKAYTDCEGEKILFKISADQKETQEIHCCIAVGHSSDQEPDYWGEGSFSGVQEEEFGC